MDPKLSDFSLSTLPGASPPEPVPSPPRWTEVELRESIGVTLRRKFDRKRLNVVLPLAASLEFAEIRGWQKDDVHLSNGLLQIIDACSVSLWDRLTMQSPAVRVRLQPTDTITATQCLAMRYRMANEKRSRGMRLSRADLDVLNRR